MNTIQVDILNPKAVRLLKDLADLDLIVIRQAAPSLEKAIRQLRKNAKHAPSLEEITKEVESVRSKRYGK